MVGQSLLPGPGDAAVFAAAVFILNATPGVDLLLTVSRTLARGARAGLATALGINAGCVVHALAAAFGLAALLAVVPAAFRAIQWAGAAYLVWLGVSLLRQAARGHALAGAAAVAPAPVGWADVRTGLLTNLLNPKVALFFLAFLPQFVPADSPAPTISFLLLGAWFVLQSMVFLIGLVALTARLARLAHLTRSARSADGRTAGPLRRTIEAVGGLLFIALALRLLAARPSAG